ncbi:UbiA prenyltransferase [Peniophora sp. CONT]|nr:UbiA prenyltransferase [Peniophora sp. CONT]
MASTWWPYVQLMRLQKFPLGTVLLMWPCVWALTMLAYRERMPLTTFAIWNYIFALSSILVHAMACVLNDICDRDLDAQVERTKNRPLPTAQVTLRAAWTLCTLLVAIALALLSMTGSLQAIEAGLVGLLLHGMYPLMKRWTFWPQGWLGVTFAWGSVMAWVIVAPEQVASDLTLLAVMLVGGTCWVIVYDSQYACQDRVDDSRLGVGSTAVLFGENIHTALQPFAVAFVGTLMVMGILNDQTAIYFVVACGGATVHFVWQFSTWNPEDVTDCGAKFKANHYLGALIWSGLLMDYYVTL